MFKVLLPVDIDEDRSLAVLNVAPEINVSDDSGGRIRSEDWYDETKIPSSVTQVSARLEEAGVAVTTRREHGKPAETILEVAEELGVDQIVMSGRKRTPVGKALFGSVTQAVLLSADQPVTIVME